MRWCLAPVAESNDGGQAQRLARTGKLISRGSEVGRRAPALLTRVLSTRCRGARSRNAKRPRWPYCASPPPSIDNIKLEAEHESEKPPDQTLGRPWVRR